MARLPRLYAAGFAQLVSMQLRSASELAPQSISEHYRDVFTWIGSGATREGVTLHGWSMTSQRIYLLATPDHEKGIPALVQSIGRNLAAQLKTGRIFSGRYRSMIPQPGVWVLPTLLWLERQAVRESLTSDPEAWPWSSAQVHTGAPGTPPTWFQPHPDYWACGNTPFDRQASYRQQLIEGTRRAVEEQIESSLRGQWGLGDASFLDELSKIAQRRVSPAPRGRPRKANA